MQPQQPQDGFPRGWEFPGWLLYLDIGSDGSDFTKLPNEAHMFVVKWAGYRMNTAPTIIYQQNCFDIEGTYLGRC